MIDSGSRLQVRPLESFKRSRFGLLAIASFIMRFGEVPGGCSDNPGRAAHTTNAHNRSKLGDIPISLGGILRELSGKTLPDMDSRSSCFVACSFRLSKDLEKQIPCGGAWMCRTAELILLLTLFLGRGGCAQEYVISTIAGGVPPPTPIAAVSASIGRPRGIAVDAAGNVYFTSLDAMFRLDQKGILTRIAGNSRVGYSGDGGPATSAQLFERMADLDQAQGVAVDNAGNLLVADPYNNRIRRVSSDGIISTVAGTGEEGYSGDGGPAGKARLRSPSGVAVDREGNFFVADSDNNCIREVSSKGIITTVAGTGDSGYSGDGGPATDAQLSHPQGLTVDSAGNLFIADSDNNRIREVSSKGIITTVAGTGDSGYSGDGGPATDARLLHPQGLTVDGAGNLFIADLSTIRKVSSDGIISTVAGTGRLGYSGDLGPAANAQLLGPSGVAMDSTGNLFIADEGRIRKVSSDGIISTVAGTGPPRLLGG